MCYTVIWIGKNGRHYTTHEVGNTNRPVAWNDFQSRPGADRIVMIVMGHHESFVQEPNGRDI